MSNGAYSSSLCDCCLLRAQRGRLHGVLLARRFEMNISEKIYQLHGFEAKMFKL